jgi:dynein intermediate chain
MDKRKEELEKKRQKLAELRKAREERKTTSLSALSSPSTSRTSVQVDRKDVDDLVASLVGSPSESTASLSRPVTADPEPCVQ